MGATCCNSPLYATQRIIFQSQSIDKLHVFTRKSDRKLLPLLPHYLSSPLPLTSTTQDLLLSYKQNERKFKHPTKIDITPQPQNRLPEPYQLKYEAETVFYVGEWVYDEVARGNIPEGVGKLYEREYISEGEIQTEVLGNGEDCVVRSYLNGKGRKYNLLECMEGEFVKGRLFGRGVYTKKEDPEKRKSKSYGTDGDDEEYSYDGSWVAGKRHGRGVQSANTYIYIGDFVHDTRTGNGNYTNKLDGDKRYKIQMEEEGFHDKIQEQLNEEKANKDRLLKVAGEKREHEGQIARILGQYPWEPVFKKESLFDHPDFQRERRIRSVWAEGYNGEFRGDLFEGQGTYTWYNGKTYTGGWVQGLMEGVGEFYWPDGTIYRGVYKGDMRHGKGEMVWCDTRRWRGTWAFGMRHGYGESICIDGEYKYLTIQGAMWDKNKEGKVYFRKTHVMRTGEVTEDVEEDLLYGDEVPEEGGGEGLEMGVGFNPFFTIEAIVENKSLSESLKERAEGRQRRYGRRLRG